MTVAATKQFYKDEGVEEKMMKEKKTKQRFHKANHGQTKRKISRCVWGLVLDWNLIPIGMNSL
jgi:hypothetical protein